MTKAEIKAYFKGEKVLSIDKYFNEYTKTMQYTVVVQESYMFRSYTLNEKDLSEDKKIWNVNYHLFGLENFFDTKLYRY